MKRLAWMLLLPIITGCKVTAGVYLEKDWQTDTKLYTRPDLRTKIKLEVERDFEKDEP